MTRVTIFWRRADTPSGRPPDGWTYAVAEDVQGLLASWKKANADKRVLWHSER